jgi:hypothetical protein
MGPVLPTRLISPVELKYPACERLRVDLRVAEFCSCAQPQKCRRVVLSLCSVVLLHVRARSIAGHISAL